MGVSPKNLDKQNCQFEFFTVGSCARLFAFATSDIQRGDIFYAHYGEEYDIEAINYSYFKSISELNNPEIVLSVPSF